MCAKVKSCGQRILYLREKPDNAFCCGLRILYLREKPDNAFCCGLRFRYLVQISPFNLNTLTRPSYKLTYKPPVELGVFVPMSANFSRSPSPLQARSFRSGRSRPFFAISALVFIGIRHPFIDWIINDKEAAHLGMKVRGNRRNCRPKRTVKKRRSIRPRTISEYGEAGQVEEQQVVAETQIEQRDEWGAWGEWNGGWWNGGWGGEEAGAQGNQTQGHYGHRTAGQAVGRTVGHPGHRTAGQAIGRTVGHQGHRTAGYGTGRTIGRQGNRTAGYGTGRTIGRQGNRTAGYGVGEAVGESFE